MNIYFIGIGGAGLSPLAQIALDCGYGVWGSDSVASLGTDELQKRGIDFSLDQSGANLKSIIDIHGIDLVVYSSAIPENNAELMLAHSQNIPSVKRHDLINTICSKNKLQMIAVAGTHGKTTTTAMTVWVFQQLNIPVSYLIGSNISFGPSAQYQKGSRYFVYECDEFDKNFLNFSPAVALITNIDYDHPDTYPTKLDYYAAFQTFISQCDSLYYYADEIADFDISDFTVQCKDSHKYLTFSTELQADNAGNLIDLAGLHNRTNAFLVGSCMENILPYFQIDTSKYSLHDILNTFPGTQRRFEKISDHIYSDYAHHPTEIAATIGHAKEINGKLVVVYQPHQNLRQKEVKDGYSYCFEGAEKVYWLPTYLSREPEGEDILTPDKLSCNVKNVDHVVLSQLDDDLYDLVKKDMKAGYTVVCMGAGSIDSWVRKHFAS
jgi:UDP-N-acetylmuramate--alanine ligase